MAKNKYIIAFNEGTIAFGNDLKITDNPYIGIDDECEQEWDNGYIEALKAREIFEKGNVQLTESQLKSIEAKKNELLEEIENRKKKTRQRVEGLANLGEQLLKLKEFQDPKIRKMIEEGIKDSKKALEDNE
jgi:ferritin-like metal-binding protein YciE